MAGFNPMGLWEAGGGLLEAAGGVLGQMQKYGTPPPVDPKSPPSEGTPSVTGAGGEAATGFPPSTSMLLGSPILLIAIGVALYFILKK